MSCKAGDRKVVVGYYGESLCPDCVDFSNGPLTDAFDEISSTFTLHYVPWGNAKILPSGEFECQHGEMECIMNTVEACALYYYSNMTFSIFWPFLHCLDSKYGTDKTPMDARTCAMDNKMEWDKIDSCRSGTMGHKLETGYAEMTNSLDPPHRYTPWITINGKHDPSAEESLIDAICNAYTGPKPEACR